jgi:hypothetical protein
MKSKYLVCFKARYGYSDSDFDLVIDWWDGADVPSLKSGLRNYIIDSYCNGKKDVSVGITITSIFPLRNGSKDVIR